MTAIKQVGPKSARPRTVRFSRWQKELLLWILREQEKHEKPTVWKKGAPRRPFFAHPIPWSVKDFLGSDPTKSQSAVLSRTLSSLEDRKLITLQGKDTEKQRRTSHVLLTLSGKYVAEALRKGHKVTEVDLFAEWPELQSRTIISKLLWAEVDRIEAALGAETDDYTSCNIPDIYGGLAKTRLQVEAYLDEVEKALVLTETEIRELRNKMDRKLAPWLRMAGTQEDVST